LNSGITIPVHLPSISDGIARDIGDLALQVALSIEAEAKREIQQSQPHGRVYRRAAVTALASQRLLDIGLRLSDRRKGHVIVGYRIHRASAPGEPPTNDTSALVNSMKAKRTGKSSAELAINAGYAGILEFEINRPFVQPAIDFTLANVLPTL
jgi:hypothetical protein